MWMRLIPRLDIKKGHVIKGINLEGLRKVGLGVDLANKYYYQGADEILLMDAVASLYKRNNLFSLVDEICERCFIPITLGGGISSLHDVERTMKSGCDKVSLNTALLAKPELIDDIVAEFGSQVLMISIEAKRIDGVYTCYYNTGRDVSSRRVDQWIEECIDRGAGELSVTSIDYEGMKLGPDLELTKLLNRSSTIPTIYHGGVRSKEHIESLVNIFPKLSGVAIASSLHYDFKEIEDFR